MRLGLGLGLVRLGRAAASFVRNGLKLYYPFKDNSPDFLLDGSTSFDSSSNNYIDTNFSFSSTNHTISVWVKYEGTGVEKRIVDIRDANDDGIFLSIDSSQQFFYALNTSDITSSAIDENEWNHAVITYDGTTQKLYVNGSLSNSATTSQTVSTSVNAIIGGKSFSTQNNNHNGRIANVGIWNRALSASEVESIYWRGSYSELKGTELTNLISWYNLSSTGLGAEVISNGTMETASSLGGYSSFPEDWTQNYGTLSVQERSSAQAFAGTHSLRFKTNASSRSGVVQTLSVTGSASYRLEFYVYGVTGSTIQITHQTGGGTASTLDGGGTLLDYEQSVTIGEWKQITFDFTTTGSGTVTGTVLQLGSNVSGNEYYIDNVSLKPIGVSAPDSQGNNDGTIEGATVNTDSYSGESPFKPRIQDKANPKMAVQLADGSTSFDGADDYISFSDTGLPSGSSARTVAGWVYFDAINQNEVWFSYGTAGTNTAFFLGQYTDNKHNVGFYGNNYRSSSNTVANQWTHICAVFEGTSLKIYLNGSLDVDRTVTGTINTTLNAGVIGNLIGNSNFHDGKIANVAIYSSALTQTQIQELMFTEKYSGLSADLKTNLVSWYDLGSETLGSNLITNGDFPSGLSDGEHGYDNGDGTVDGWTGIVGDVLSLDSSTKDGSANSLKIVNSSGWLTASYNLGTLTDGKVYRVSYDISVVSGGANRRVGISNNTSSGSSEYLSGASATPTDGGGWESGSFTFQKSTTETSYFKVMGYTATIYLDNIVVQELSLEDSEGSNTGYPIGATTNTGYTYSPHGVVDPLNFGEVYSGRALSFDGTNDFVTLSKPDFMNGESAFTISAWALHDDTGSDVIITTDAELFLGYNTGKLTASYKETDGTRNRKIATDTLNSGEWYHLCATWDKSGDGEIKLYVNGYYVAQSYNDGGASTASVIKNGTSARVGAWVVGSQEMDGKLSSIKVFNTALTQDQVRELYTKPETVLPTGVSASNLKLDLPMQEGSGSYIYDGSGNQNHGTISGATWVSGEEYGYQASLVRSNTPMIFDSTDDSVTVTDSSSIQNVFDSGGTISAWVYINSAGENGTGRIMDKRTSGAGWIFYTDFSIGNNVRFFQEFSTTDGRWDMAITTGQWNHLVVTYDNSSASNNPVMYLNGVSQTVSEVVTPVGTRLTDIGQNLYIGNRSDGTSTFDGIINEVAIWDVALDADAVTALYGSGTPLLPTSDSGNYDNSDSLVGYWRNDSNTTWTDRANTGVASFDGTDDYLDLSGLEYSENTHTFSFWVNSTQSSNIPYLLDFSPNRSALGFNNPSSADVGIYDGVSWKTFGSINDGNWHHLVYVLDGTSATVYDNGSQLGSTQTISAFDLSDTSQGIKIGRHYSASQSYYDGKMANVNFFNTALTATEVSELYAIDKRSSISGHSQFSNCVASYLMGAGDGDTASTIQDQTSNNNDGTVNGAGLVGYNDGTASGSPVSILIPEGSTEGRDNQGYYLSDTTTISNGARFHGSEYIKLDVSQTLNFGTTNFSAECWSKKLVLDDYLYLIKWGHSSDPRWYMRHNNNGKLAFTVDDGTTAIGAESSSTVLDNDWHHYAFTFDRTSSTGLKIYIDGSLDSSHDFSSFSSSDLTNNTYSVWIGISENESLYHMNGLIDEVRIYNKELSADEVSKNYNNGKTSHQ